MVKSFLKLVSYKAVSLPKVLLLLMPLLPTPVHKAVSPPKVLLPSPVRKATPPLKAQLLSTVRKATAIPAPHIGLVGLEGLNEGNRMTYVRLYM